MDGSVRTVLGDVPADWIGPTLCHEHVLLDARALTGDPDWALPDVEEQAEELRLAQRLGLSTVVDNTTPELGRDPLALKRIAAASGVQVVAASGYLPASAVGEQPVEQLATHLVAEVERGIDDTGVRAGIIGELGSGASAIQEPERRQLEAAALAQRRTGVAISTHAPSAQLGSQQLDVLLAHGADPRKVLIGHLDGAPGALGACVAIARRGAYVGIDRVGDPRQGSDDERERLVLGLAERGLLDRVLLSHDLSRRSRLVAHGGSGYTAVLAEFAPRLRERGLSDADLELLLVHNPRRWLALSPRGSQ